ncbi:MAG: OmpA family protein [Thalassobaculaceae bacterium]
MRGHRAHVALTLIAAAIAASAGTAPAWAQTVTSPYIEPNPNVTVDLSVLDGYGGPASAPRAPRPGVTAPGSYAAPVYTAPGQSTGAAPGIPGFLVRPDAPRYAAPPPEVQALIQGRSGSAPARSAVRSPASNPSPAPVSAPSARSQSQASAPTPVRRAEPEQTASAPAAAPATSQQPRQQPRASTSSASGAPAVPPPPSVPEPSRTAAAAPPPPPPALPRNEPAQPVSAPAVAATSGTAPSAAPSPSAQSAGGDTTRIAFPSGQSQLPADAGSKLDPVVARLKQDDQLRVQLMAYADGDQDGANKARRLSLSRALAVRAYLIDNEIASTRMDVRALGNRADEGPADRVDLVVINR